MKDKKNNEPTAVPSGQVAGKYSHVLMFVKTWGDLVNSPHDKIDIDPLATDHFKLLYV